MSDQNKNAKNIAKALKKRHEFIDHAEDEQGQEGAGPNRSIRMDRGTPYLALRTLSAATRDLEKETVAASRDMLHNATIRLEVNKEAEDLQQINQMIRESPSEESDDAAGSSAANQDENYQAMVELAFARYCVQKRILKDNPSANIRVQVLDEYEVLDKLKDLSASNIAIELQTQTAEGNPPVDFSGDSFANIIEAVKKSLEENDFEDDYQRAPRSQASNDGEFNYQGYLNAINDRSIPASPKDSEARVLTGPLSYGQLKSVLDLEDNDVGLAINISSKFLRDKKIESTRSCRPQTPCGRPLKTESKTSMTGREIKNKKSIVALKTTDIVDPFPEIVADMLKMEEDGTPMTTSPDEMFNRLFPGGVMAAAAETNLSKSKPRIKKEEDDDDDYSITAAKDTQTEMADLEPKKEGSEMDFDDFNDQNDDDETPPKYSTRISLRSSVLPKWFPGYLMALPDTNGMQFASCPSTVLTNAYNAAEHTKFKESSVIIIGD